MVVHTWTVVPEVFSLMMDKSDWMMFMTWSVAKLRLAN